MAAGLVLLTSCSNFHPAATGPGTITVAAAADLQFAMDELLQNFRRRNPAENVKVVYGSSGNFYSQIQNHAPFDVFLSADIQYPRRLVDEGLAIGPSLFTYATGRLAVWVPQQSPLDLSRGLAVLVDPRVRHIAIANPEHAPYGRAAMAALKSAGLFERVQAKLVLGENIAQTLQFVQSGSAEVGLVALSLAVAPPVATNGRYWEIPLNAYPPIEQGGVVTLRARHARLSTAFAEYMQTSEARTILKRYGFSLPDKE